MADGGEDIYCTLVLNDGYLPGAAVLAHSLRDSGTTKKLACMIAQDNLRDSNIEELRSLYNYVIPIERIGNPSPANLYLMNRPDLLYTFSKVHLWRFTQFRKIVYIDADVVALRAPEELFALPDAFAAAPDVGWPDCFNTGVMVLRPDLGDYHALRTLANAGDSFDGADQGLLNQYFEHRPWKRLSFTYNTTPSANYQYEPAYRYFKRDISMVHFIGSEKPWQRGRDVRGAPAAFQESLGRWWAVWDRHYQVSTHDYIEGHRHPPPQQQPYYHNHQQHNQHQHQHQHQHHHHQQNAYYATGYPIATTQPAPPPEIHIHRPSDTPAVPSELPMSEPGEPAENLAQGHTQPTPTVEQRRFSAPQMEWDATRGAPPVESRPEAAHFPTTTYEFNTDPEPFRPPPSYPEPPRDMWYEVPKEKPRLQEKPRAIFPWEERGEAERRPTRRFVEDAPPPPPEPEPEPDADSPAGAFADELEVSSDEKTSAPPPPAPEIKVQPANIWETFNQSRNAWDDMAGIDRYVRALTAHRRGPSGGGSGTAIVPPPAAAASSTATAGAAPGGVLSPTKEILDPEDLVQQVEKRRESLILTDFPSAAERPSLPVTPAPRRRTFWGSEGGEGGAEEGDAEGRGTAAAALPVAEGVPHQAEWNPAAQLEQLRRNSVLAATDLQLPPPKNKVIPDREMPPTATPVIPEEVLGHPVAAPAQIDGAAAVEDGDGDATPKAPPPQSAPAPTPAPETAKPIPATTTTTTAATTVLPHSGGSSPHGLDQLSPRTTTPAAVPDAVKHNTDPATTALVTGIHTALNAASSDANPVGKTLFAMPDFSGGTASGKKDVPPPPPAVDEVDRAKGVGAGAVGIAGEVASGEKVG